MVCAEVWSDYFPSLCYRGGTPKGIRVGRFTNDDYFRLVTNLAISQGEMNDSPLDLTSGSTVALYQSGLGMLALICASRNERARRASWRAHKKRVRDA